MNKPKQFKSRAISAQKSINQPEDNFIQTIDGVRVTLGCDPNNLFNLSQLGRLKPYQTDKYGNYDKSRPILQPLEWIRSDSGQSFIHKCCNNSEDILFTSGYQYIVKSPATIYTRSYYLWLGYLKHCIDDIDTAINAELAN
ncbi:MAG: hypothetical protein K0R14_398 [Burkholderiales bacterium]|jgi:hypothetical protein|nr:hypothetical protein [Burkholderiales bacterium]